MKKSLIAKIISIFLRFMIVGGIIVQFFVPEIYKLFLNISFNSQSISYRITFYICGIVSILIVYMLTRIFDHIYKCSPFNKDVEVSLKIIAILFMLLSIIVGVKTIFITTLLSIVISIITFVVSLCFYVLSQVFKAAIEYKEEVDYTI